MNKWRRAYKAQQRRVCAKVRAIKLSIANAQVAVVMAMARAQVTAIASTSGDQVRKKLEIARTTIAAHAMAAKIIERARASL